LISKRLDPVFAIAVGLGAAGVRIRRDDRALGRSAAETMDAARRRARIVTRWVGLG